MPTDESQDTDHELLTAVEGVGPDLAERLLEHFGSGRKVAQSACRYWGELTDVDGVSEEKARSMFDRMHVAGVFEDLKQCYSKEDPGTVETEQAELVTDGGVNPQTDPEARLRQVRDEIDALLEGDSAREMDGRGVGDLSDIESVVFGLYGSGRADLRVTQEPESDAPAPVFCILGEYIDGLAAMTGRPPKTVAAHAIAIMDASRDSDEYDRSASASAGGGR